MEILSSRHTENGIPVEYHSDIDGDRYIIIAPEDADMTGWRLEVGPDEDWYRNRGLGPTPDWRKSRIVPFDREHHWYRYRGAEGGWFHLGYGEREIEYPWSAFVDHGERIIRWIGPDEE